MRIAILTTALLLVAGCSAGTDEPGALSPIPSKSHATTASSSPEKAPARTPKTTVTSTVPTAVPTGATPIENVIAWVGAGQPADPSGFHTATRDGVATQLGDDIAFVTPSGTTKCMTAARAGGALACRVDLTDPPTQPADSYGQWIGGWVDFDGTTLNIGSAHADPGRFSRGDGAALPYGSSVRFGDYQCRADQAGLFCVNYAHLSGAKLADSGVEPLGCLRLVSQPEPGMKFSC